MCVVCVCVSGVVCVGLVQMKRCNEEMCVCVCVCV